jgi:hypothetical protein
MHCPPDFRKVHSSRRRKDLIDQQIFDAEWVAKLNREKQTPTYEHYNLV